VDTRNTSFREYENVLSNRAIRGEHKLTYLNDLHKAIAKRRIEMFLDGHGGRIVVDPNTLPVRTNDDFVAAGGNDNGTIDFALGQRYQNYQTIIDNIANDDYNEVKINGFVVEVCRKIAVKRGTFASMRAKGNRIDALADIPAQAAL